MPREGTKTPVQITNILKLLIEIRYAPGGDENYLLLLHYQQQQLIEIRYAPGGDENNTVHCHTFPNHILRLDMPREGTKTL